MSLKSDFLINKKNHKFQNENEVLKHFYKIFGKYDDLGIPCDGYTDNNIFMKRIKTIIEYEGSK